MNRSTSSGLNPDRQSATRGKPTRPSLPVVDNWRVAAVLGRGATATVYAASPVEQASDAEPDYALKLLNPALNGDALAHQRLLREATVARQVTHANLVSVLAASLQVAPYYLVLPRLRGATLAETLAFARTCSIPRALWIARQVADALAAVHAAGWMHLDVKPANIMLDHSGHCTLIDLDLSLPCKVPVCASSRDLRGTLAYTAPELLVSSTAAQRGSDVYSLGVVLYEALCGRLPFCCGTAKEFVEAHLRQIPPSARTYHVELPIEVSRLISRMLSKQPERRPSTDGELQDELARLEIATFGMRSLLAADAEGVAASVRAG